MKSVAIFFTGALLGAGLVFLATLQGPKSVETGYSGQTRADMEELEEENAGLKNRVAELESKRKEIQARQRDARVVRNSIPKNEFEAAKGNGARKGHEMWKKQNEELRKNRTLAELERLRGPLNLSEDQEKTV
ncbi:MAG: hypothetical protein AAGJ79_15085, partial [Verrucomicrobiota bacterium]